MWRAGAPEPAEEPVVRALRPQPDDWDDPEFLRDLQEDCLTHTPPGTQLLDHISRVDLDGDSEEVLLAALAAAHRMETHAAAMKARLAGALAGRPLLRRHDRAGEVSFAPEEVAMTLGVTRQAADRLIGVGRHMIGKGPLHATACEFSGGRISQAKAETIVGRLEEVPTATALAVEERVLPRAPRRTVRQLERDIAKALIEVDPEGADVRHRAARERRYVGRPRVAEDGMARISLFLPADGAATLSAALDACAGAARSAGDDRTADQVRADALCEWAAGACRDGWTFTACGSSVTSAPTRISVTVPLTVLARTIPGMQLPTSLADAIGDEIVGSAGGGGGGGETRGATGSLHEVAHLDGYGPIPNMIALLLAADGTWRRIVTDPLSGLPLDIGRGRYTPPAHIADAVRLRDRTCVRPGCSAPASRCEIDHVQPWSEGGHTAARNLACLCGRCHRVKTVGGGGPVGPPGPGGVRTWVSATGRKYHDGESPPAGADPPESGGPPGGHPDELPPWEVA